ncbi:branched-chain amino acid ABC transporter substrate-binding protein [Desulfonatronovibrio magnus]|uniref:branched-chain amino acid ABC transporter substrate-binding protein n=1 Tax=Desulfonatronovibrio magnus TaxID=698827 RepID=UPI0006971DED|nr:branched-chain amino acid ABC transporter substrate-binding protein [Desulfonatronovibrio magnus]
MKEFYLVLFNIILFLTACGQDKSSHFDCTDPLGCVHLQADDPIKIVTLQALTGPLANSGLEYTQGMKLASSMRNHVIKGHPIEISIFDCRCSREGGFIAAQKITSEPSVIAVHGTTCSSSSVPAAEILSNAGMVLISGNATAPSLTSIEGRKGEHWQPGFFRTVASDIYQGVAAAHFSFQYLGISKAATVNDGDPYTAGLTSSFESAFKNLGGEVVFSSEVNKGDTNMVPLLEAIAMSGSEMLFLPLFPSEGYHIVKQKSQVDGLDHLILMTADGMLNYTLINTVSDNAPGLYFVSPKFPDTLEYKDFTESFSAMFNQKPKATFHAQSFDSALLLLSAIENASQKLGDGSLIIMRQELRDALYSTRNFTGVTGSLNCDEFGDCGIAGYNLLRFDEPEAGFEGLINNIVSTYKSTP